jgi:hypothetical protein
MRSAMIAFLLWASAASATTPKVAVLPFSGAEGAFVREQLLAVVCEQMTCVPPSQVMGHKGTDWAKVHTVGLDGVVQGTVSKAHGAIQLTLELFEKPKHAAWHTNVKLDKRGHLAPSQDRSVMIELERHLHGAASPLPPVAAPPAAASPASEEASVEPPQTKPAVTPAPSAPAAASAPALTRAPATAGVRAPAPVETAAMSHHEPEMPRRYKPLPPELLDSRPRI